MGMHDNMHVKDISSCTHMHSRRQSHQDTHYH